METPLGSRQKSANYPKTTLPNVFGRFLRRLRFVVSMPLTPVGSARYKRMYVVSLHLAGGQ